MPGPLSTRVQSSHATQDGHWMTRAIVGFGVVTVSTPRAYAEGEAIQIEPAGHGWRLAERISEAA
jgi:hypothetical protein